jgi:endonuclease/exonuclease/phosphatase family metal-dependent hydrolase
MNKIKLSGICKFLIAFMAVSCSSIHSVKQQEVIQTGKNQTETVIRIMTYNVHHCNPPSKSKTGEIETSAVAEVIRKQNPDIIALQEIDDHTRRSGPFNEAKDIAVKLGMYFYFAKAIDYAGGGYGVAILSRFPISEEVTYRLPSSADTTSEHRVLAAAKIILPGGKSIRFGCTHLDVKNAANRELQVQDITRIALSDNLPFIVGGDFNDTPESKPIQLLDAGFHRTCHECAPTIPSGQPVSNIDYIAFLNSAPFTVVSHEVIEDSYPSDHLAVVAVLQFKK